jgi:hypothetical protein
VGIIFFDINLVGITMHQSILIGYETAYPLTRQILGIYLQGANDQK